MGVRIYTEPSVEPIALAQLREHLRLDPYEFDSSGVGSHPHDDMIMRMLTGARQEAEEITGLSIALKTYELALDAFPDDQDVELPYPPLVSISAVAYVTTDSAGDYVEETLDASAYTMDRHQRTEGWVSPAAGTTWPTPSELANAVKIRYRAGYQIPEPDSSAEDALTMPGGLFEALVLLTQARYDKDPNAREQAERLLQTFVVRLRMA